MAQQTMSGRAAQERIDREVVRYSALLGEETWTLEHAHQVLRSDTLDLFQIAGLAKAIACFQCSAE